MLLKKFFLIIFINIYIYIDNYLGSKFATTITLGAFTGFESGI